MQSFAGNMFKKNATVESFKFASRSLLGAAIGGATGALVGAMGALMGCGLIQTGVVGGFFAGAIAGGSAIHLKNGNAVDLTVTSVVGTALSLACFSAVRNDPGCVGVASAIASSVSFFLPKLFSQRSLSSLKR